MKSKLLLLLLILVSFLPLLDLTKSGAYKADDIFEHAGRLSSFYEALKQGNIIPRWAGNLNYGYGHPVFIFLYPLTNYLGSILHFLSFSFIDSIKILFAISYVLSGLAMFLWVTELWNPQAGFLASLFYLFAPYRFVNLYVRAALAEHLIYVFLPLSCWLLLKFVKTAKKKYFLLTSLSISLTILAHNLLSIVFLGFILVYSVYLIVIYKKKKIFPGLLKIFLSIMLGFCLSAFFWLPAIVEAKYTLMSWIPLKDLYIKNYINFKDLTGINSNFQVGWFNWFVFLLGLYFVYKNKIEQRSLVVISYVYFLMGIFLTNKTSLWILNLIPSLAKFQFPWRFLAMSIFASSVIAGSLVSKIEKKYRKILIIFLALGVIFSSKNYWHIKGREVKSSDQDIINYAQRSTTETGESTPRWTIRFQKNFPPAKVQLVWGKLDDIVIKKWLFQEHIYEARLSADSQLVDNTLYFPGWKVYVDGGEVPIQFQDQNWRGLITFAVPSGTHEIMVKFTHTQIRMLAELITLGGFFILIILFMRIL